MFNLSNVSIDGFKEDQEVAEALRARLSIDRYYEMVRDIVETTETFGIRDWSKEPFGAGCHAWKPGVKSWEVRERLKAFSLFGHATQRNVHICGEAYSAYQGFIEGALQSAADVVANISENSEKVRQEI